MSEQEKQQQDSVHEEDARVGDGANADTQVDKTDEGKDKSAQSQSQSGDKDYDKIIAGLNRTISRKDAEIQRLREQISELQAKLEEKNGEVSTLSEAKQRVGQLEQDLSKKEKELARAKLIMSKFPHLAEMEADGLLPDASDIEELEQRLEVFSQKMQALIAEEAKARSRGTVPRSKEDGLGSMKDEALIEKAFEAQRKGDMGLYNKIMDLLASRK